MAKPEQKLIREVIVHAAAAPGLATFLPLQNHKICGRETTRAYHGLIHYLTNSKGLDDAVADVRHIVTLVPDAREFMVEHYGLERTTKRGSVLLRSGISVGAFLAIGAVGGAILASNTPFSYLESFLLVFGPAAVPAGRSLYFARQEWRNAGEKCKAHVGDLNTLVEAIHAVDAFPANDWMAAIPTAKGALRHIFDKAYHDPVARSVLDRYVDSADKPSPPGLWNNSLTVPKPS